MVSVPRRILSIGILLVVILACNLPQPAPPSQEVNAATAAALTVAAVINSPQASALPSATATLAADTSTPIPTLSPTLILTTTPSVPIITVSVDTNCRLGPGLVYERVGGLLVGETAQVIAKDPGGQYWYIRDSESPTGYCWVWGQYATVTGNITVLPVYTPPATPTAAPSFDVAYGGLDTCVGWWVEFKLKNTGSAQFKSYSLTVKDQTTSTTISDSGNGFTDLNGCLTSNTVTTLDPDDTLRISSPAFVYNPTGHKLRATITLCTKNGQAGMCVSQTITFKP